MIISLEEYQISEKLKRWRDSQDARQAAHVGTHIDVYNHTMLEDEFKCVRGVVMDVRGIQEIGVEDLKGVELLKGDFAILRTGYMEKYGYGSESYFDLEGAPHLKTELVDYLIFKGVKFIGIDFHSIQLGAEHRKIDIYCEERGTYVVENLTNLEKLNGVVKLKLKFQQEDGATAIPVEIEAVEKEEI